MLIKGICSNCAGHLEFEEENAGERIDCPHCGFETALVAPGSEELAELAAGLARKRKLRQRLIWGGWAALVFGVGFGLYHWVLPVVRDFLPFPYGDSHVWPVVVLVLLCLSAPFVLAWLIFPVIIILQMRQLIQKLTGIETQIRPVASEKLAETAAAEMNLTALETPSESRAEPTAKYIS